MLIHGLTRGLCMQCVRVFRQPDADGGIQRLYGDIVIVCWAGLRANLAALMQ